MTKLIVPNIDSLLKRPSFVVKNSTIDYKNSVDIGNAVPLYTPNRSTSSLKTSAKINNQKCEYSITPKI